MIAGDGIRRFALKPLVKAFTKSQLHCVGGRQASACKTHNAVFSVSSLNNYGVNIICFTWDFKYFTLDHYEVPTTQTPRAW